MLPMQNPDAALPLKTVLQLLPGDSAAKLPLLVVHTPGILMSRGRWAVHALPNVGGWLMLVASGATTTSPTGRTESCRSISAIEPSM